MKSKEDNLLELFFNNPTREWHFEEILLDAGIARSKASRWLKSFANERLIKKVKEIGKMPYYVGNYDSPSYQNKKRLYALNRLYESGLLNHLSSLKKASSVVLFGSFTRWDWHKSSDIDLFVYGDPVGLKIREYELKLHRDIQVFACKDKSEIKKLGEGLIRNIIKGDLIKGDLGFVEVGMNA
jgi:predicted nucleotidyltransferase